jgi:hypothetical protein
VPSGVRLAGPSVYVQAPAASSDPPVEFTYGDTDGSAPSLAQVIVHAVPGAQLPPVANDVTAPLPGAGAKSVTVNVLKNDDDPVGSPGDLTVNWAGAGATVAGPDLTIKLAAQPRAVPYQIKAPDGFTATAVVYVPGTQTSAIRLKPGARIALAKNGSAAVSLGSVLTDTAGRPLKISTSAGLAASPANGLTVSANQATAVTLRAAAGYVGPGAVTVDVYDGATQQDPDGNTATVTIPVQVGPDVPILRCPATPLPVVAGGAAQSYDIGQLCHVWVDTTIAQPAPRYTVSWTKPASGVSASVPNGTSLLLSAASTAKGGTTGTLRVTPAGGAAGGTLKIQLTGTPPLPVGQAVSVATPAGQRVTIDLRQYVTSPLAQPDISVLRVTRPGGATVTSSGALVTITPAAGASGTISLVAQVSDEAAQADRAVSVPITVTVIGHPGAPGRPTATASGNVLVVSFTAAAPNGAPVEYYSVHANGTVHQCAASPCPVTGLTSGSTYTVYVTATNSAGPGPASAKVTAQLNAVPGQVTGLSVTPGNGQLVLAWQAASASGAPVTGYSVEISPPPAGQPQIATVGTARSHIFTGLANGTSYTFTVRAASGQGEGPWSLGVTAIPRGRPSTMAAPTATAAATGTSLGVTVSWAPAAANGSPVTAYTVDEYRATANAGPWGNPVAAQTVAGGATDSASFAVNTGGGWYSYSVAATNAAGTSAQSPRSTPAIQSAAPPPAPANVTATAGTGAVQVTFTLPASATSVTSIEFGLNSPAESGTVDVAAGRVPHALTITSAMSSAVAVGTPVTVYLAACATATLCSAWSGPSNQVRPHGALASPTVTATANGTSVAYTWGATPDGQTATLTVCINTACTGYPVPATGTYSGSRTVAGYAPGQTETITAYVTDSSGQRAPAAGTVTASAVIAAANGTLAVSMGPEAPPAYGIGSAYIHIAVTNMPPNSVVNYTCTDNPDDFKHGTAGTSYDTDSSGATVRTDASGSASFDSTYIWAGAPTARLHPTATSVTCSSGNASDTYTAPAVPPSVTISEGSANPGGTTNCRNCHFVQINTAGWVVGGTPSLTCTTGNPAYGLVIGPVTGAVTPQNTQTSEDDSSGNALYFQGGGLGGPPVGSNWESNIEWVGGFIAGATLSCSVTDAGTTVQGTYP